MNTTTADKERLRREIPAHGAASTDEERAALEPAMRERVLALPEVRAARGVLVCLSFGDEPPTRPLIEALVSEGKSVYLPRAERVDRALHLHPWPCALETLRFGLAQPTRSAPALDDAQIAREVEVAVILGLAFDEGGYRLGYGTGYVDRFLTAHPMFAVGLAFDELLVPRLPRATHDVPMSAIVTPARIVRPPADPRAALRKWLLLDHAEIGDLLARSVIHGRLDAAAFESFRERLLRHIGIEEKLVFPAIRQDADPGLAEGLATLRREHAALTSLLVPTPDPALAAEIHGLLERHDLAEETPGGIYDQVLARLTDERARELLIRARARDRVPTVRHFDGPGTVRTAAEALARATRGR